jgi:hypothetical protein
MGTTTIRPGSAAARSAAAARGNPSVRSTRVAHNGRLDGTRVDGISAGQVEANEGLGAEPKDCDEPLMRLESREGVAPSAVKPALWSVAWRVSVITWVVLGTFVLAVVVVLLGVLIMLSSTGSAPFIDTKF